MRRTLHSTTAWPNEYGVERLRKAARQEDPYSHFQSPEGVSGIEYGTDENGDDFATVGFNLHDLVYAEIEEGTYGAIQGFRVYLDTTSEA